jgi:outer membrane receptor protein involved in Fe transport
VQSGSDLVKDVSGVAVSKGANGSSNVSVRGIDQRMLRITVDGKRQGGPGNPLDSIPPEIVQSLEVTKTFTPDMEADAVGGVINTNTGGTVIKDAYLQGRHQITYNSLAPQPGSRNSLTLGQPFKLSADERNASILATVSFDDQSAQRERVSTLREWTPQISPGPIPYTNTEVPVLTLPLIESTVERRQRAGLVLNGDARFDTSSLYWRSNLSRDEVKRNRDFDDTNPADGVAQSLTPQFGTFSAVYLSRRNQDQLSRRDAFNFSLGAKQRRDHHELDGVIAYSSTKEAEPHTLEAGFLNDHTYRVSYDIASNPFEPRFAVIDESNPFDTTAASDQGRYHLNYLNVTASTINEHEISSKLNLKVNLGDTANYLKFGGKAQRRRRLADTDRNVFGSVSPLSMSGLVDATNDYIEILPGLHLRYEPQGGLLYRASITRSMSRPNNADIAPYRTLSFIDRRSRIGAPELKPYLATNFDFSVDWYEANYGLLSFALFYKKIDHFITDAQYPVVIGNLGDFIEFKRVNGETTKAMGAEVGWQSAQWEFPMHLGRGSLEANYSVNHGEAHHPTRPNETFPLPRQVDHQANLKLHETHGSISIDATLGWRSGWWEDLIAPGFDNYIESAWDADVTAAYRLSKGTRITAGASNLFDRATRHYAGSRARFNDS